MSNLWNNMGRYNRDETDPSFALHAQRRHQRLKAEMAKEGIPHAPDGLGPKSDKSTLLTARADLRRFLNASMERAEREKRSYSDAEVEAQDEASREIMAISSILDLIDAGAAYDAKNGVVSGSSSSDWKTGEGKSVRVLSKSQPFAAGNKYDDHKVNFGFADCIRAMALGSGRQEIRAAISEGSDAAGGFTVPDVLSRRLVDKMRARTQCIQAGALTVELQSDQQFIARLESDALGGWRLENAAITESDPTFSRIAFNARSLAVMVKVSRELLEDNVVNLEDAMMNAFAASMAVELDRVMLIGSGTAPEPRGIYTNSGINVVSMGTNGAALQNYSPILDAILKTDQANAADPTAAIMNPRTWRTVQGFTDTTGQPLMPPPALKDLPMLRSTIVPVDQTHGTANNASSIFLGDFSHLMLGMRSALRVEMLRERFADNHQYAFIAHLRADVQLVRPESFCVIKGIIPS